MKKYVGIIIGIAAVLALPLLFFVISRQGLVPPTPSSQQGAQPSGENAANHKLMPELSLKDLEGTTVSLKGFKGKYVAINTWASWCPFCVKELPDFAATQKKHKDSVVFIAINRGESREAAKKFIDERGVGKDMIYLLDPDDSFYKAIEGFSMPETIFVDREGIIAEHKRGPLTLQEVEEKIKNLLKQ